MHLTYQKNKKSGVTYVYESISYWDKDKKQSRSKRVCVGKLDQETGELISSKKLENRAVDVLDKNITATTKVVGASIIMNAVASEVALEETLKSCFPEKHSKIMSLAHYLTAKGGALSSAESWSKSHDHPVGAPFANQRISELLRSISDDEMQTFYKEWKNKILENDYLCYDITSISSYAQSNEFVKSGYNRDGDSLKQINLGMLFGQKSELPVYFSRYPGSINDVSTLKDFLKTSNFLDFPKLRLIMDKGFFSMKNINELLETRNKFTIAIPGRLKWLQSLIDDVGDDIYSIDAFNELDGEALNIHTELYPWGDKRRRCYVHLYYNEHLAANASQEFIKRLLRYKEELESGNLIKGNEDYYDTFFIIKETPIRGKKISFNDEVIKKHRKKYAGYFAILTNDIKDPVEALRVYRNKDVVEKSFDDLKNHLDMKRLRVHNSKAMDGRLFVQFIALILISALRKKMRDSGLSGKYTVRELLGEMETLSKITYSSKYGHMYTEVTKSQRNILESMGVEIPT